MKPFMVAAGVFTSASSLVNVLKDRLIYSPNYPDGNARFLYKNPFGYRSPADRGIDFDDVFINTEDGVLIHAWLLKQKKTPAPTLVFFHGNAGNMGMRMDNLQDFYEELQVNVFIVSYRGYGKSQGYPFEEGLQLDAKASLDWVFQSPLVDPRQVFIFGRSLGGAVAIYVANTLQSKHSIKGLIIENTFTSINDVVNSFAPSFSFFSKLLLRKQWPSLERIQSISCPLLFISGEKDLLIPPGQMKTLSENCFNAKFVEFKSVPNAGHNDTYQVAGKDYLEWMRTFIIKAIN
jgi:fermentation-respiration switch protein FrsA (DUF1100 family)